MYYIACGNCWLWGKIHAILCTPCGCLCTQFIANLYTARYVKRVLERVQCGEAKVYALSTPYYKWRLTNGVGHTVKYSPDIIQQYANELDDRARQFDKKVERMTTIYLVLGALAGFAIAASQTSNFAHMLIAVGLGGFICGVIAECRAIKLRKEAFRIRLQAQTALCQLQIEKNTKNLNTNVPGREGS